MGIHSEIKDTNADETSQPHPQRSQITTFRVFHVQLTEGSFILHENQRISKRAKVYF